MTSSNGNHFHVTGPLVRITGFSWWRYQMETISTLLALCAGNSPVTGELPSQRPVTGSFDVFFDLRLISGMMLNFIIRILSCFDKDSTGYIHTVTLYTDIYVYIIYIYIYIYYTIYKSKYNLLLDSWQLAMLLKSERCEFSPRMVHDNFSAPLRVYYMHFPVR